MQKIENIIYNGEEFSDIKKYYDSTKDILNNIDDREDITEEDGLFIDRTESILKLIFRYVYDNVYESCTMYGLCLLKHNDKKKLYYDPINEAINDIQIKRGIRLGHCISEKAPGNMYYQLFRHIIDENFFIKENKENEELVDLIYGK